MYPSILASLDVSHRIGTLLEHVIPLDHNADIASYSLERAMVPSEQVNLVRRLG